MTSATDWGKVLQDLDWASVIATVGAIVVALITYGSGRSAERRAKTQERHINSLVAALETANEHAAEQLKRTTNQVNRLITAVQQALSSGGK